MDKKYPFLIKIVMVKMFDYGKSYIHADGKLNGQNI